MNRLLLFLLLIVLPLGIIDTAKASTWALIDISSQKAYIYRDGEIIISSPISSGSEGCETDLGTFRITQKRKDHISYYGQYISHETGEVVLADANMKETRRPSGTYFKHDPMTWFLRFNGPIGFHAGDLPGYPASHGCIRLPMHKAEAFYQALRLGTKVVIQP